MSPPGRIVIYGAGNIGLYLGGRLLEHTPVRFVGRPATANALTENGLHLSDWHGWKRHLRMDQLDFHTSPEAAADADLVLVCVKSSATATVAHELSRVLAAHSIVVNFQNGLENANRLREALPQHTVLAGMVPFNVLQHSPGVLHQGSGGELMAAGHPALHAYLPLFAQAGLPLRLRSDMDAVLRAKLLFNLNNAINALSDLPLKQELSMRDWRRCLAIVQREALDAFQAAAMPVARLTPLPAAWLPRALELPDALFLKLAPRMLAIDPQARSSTWEDLRAGRATEVDALHGAVVRLAALHGLRADANACLQELIRDAENKRTPWTAQALLARLRSARRHAT
ncbi:2-dehydropantoate 2-reductase [Dyella sp. GSA-30]|uniref:2-dehydropantoate 2-reductase n=1 Tax=Dyella sp. GSA-30 TaxID=2994496 RepID=UPI00249125F4|nr:2-dehydropantoate 2-reductase [Dyella sp. GSA-30]BDU18724.1 2-dehydropantoate 2-reductase [Dyella sp. GSA-30]